MAVRRQGAICLLLILPAACASKATGVAPAVDLPEAFSEAGAEPLPERWWLSFEDPALEDLVGKALADNLDLRVAWDRLAQAEAAARREGAPLRPSLDVLAGASYHRSRVAASGGGEETLDFDAYSVGLVAAYEVDLWGRIRASHGAAGLDVQASAEDLRAGAITLSAEVARTWYRLVEQHGQLELLASQLQVNEQVLELVTLRFRRGQVGAADVLRQRQLVESIRGEAERARGSAAVLEHQLAILLGRSPTEEVAPTVSELVELLPLPATGLPAELVRRRPDVRSAYFDVLASDQRIAAAVADRFPRIVLSAGASTSAAGLDELFQLWMTNIAADLVGPILDGGRRRAEVERTRAVLSERLHDYGQVILESFGEVEDALVLEARQRQLIASLERQLELSDQASDRIADSYTQGAVDYLRVLEALLTNQGLQRSMLAARRELIEYRIDLCRALAGGWEMERPALADLERERPGDGGGANDEP